MLAGYGLMNLKYSGKIFVKPPLYRGLGGPQGQSG
jgi:hypothetical protein